MRQPPDSNELPERARQRCRRSVMKNATVFVATTCLLVAASAPARTQGLEGTLKKVQETGTITVGHRDSSIPLSYLDDKLQPVGFSIELCKHVANAVKADRKSTRLNSSHLGISYAVFCLKK